MTSRPVAWLSVRLLPGLDRAIYRLTGGRFTFSAWVTGLPVVLLCTTGARSGRTRTARVLGIPDGDGLVVIAANFGQTSHPAWYHNVRAHPEVTVVAGGARRNFHAHELAGAERAQQFERAVAMNPGWTRFQDRAGSRDIPVIRLEPRA
ncbi:nitroreductase family deazaflavin-dependent oxidoreductase [Pseudonocardia sp.]|uniref:nitroreductase family deazaflavin-dependent oxidoreductase n=1 Tax=Pseudonocardia sp. TaxID=60912 RepID=UPI003D1295BD